MAIHVAFLGELSSLIRNQLTDRLRLSGAFITNEVNKLVSDGLIEKSTHPSDGRRVQLAVTEIRRFTFISAEYRHDSELNSQASRSH